MLTLLSMGLQIASVPVSYAMLIQTAAVGSRTPEPLGDSLRRGALLLPRALLLTLFICLSALVVLIPILLILLAIAPLNNPRNATFYSGGLVVYFVICAFLFLRIVLYPVYMVLGNGGAFASLAGSWKLTQGYWWRMLAVFSVYGALYLILVGVLTATVFEIGAVLGVPSATRKVVVGFLPLISALMSPLFYSINFNVFLDLKARKEGSDLLHRLTAMDST